LNDALDVKDAPTVKIDPGDAAATIRPEDVEGRSSCSRLSPRVTGPRTSAAFARISAELSGMRPAMILNYGPRPQRLKSGAD